MAKIKNNVSENTITNHNSAELDVNNQVMNWISQINVGGTVHDIATHHSIKFYDGSNDTEGVVWNGLTDIEVVIPSVTDIVNTPVVFVGTVGADGKIVWTPEYTSASEETTPEAGYLVFITEGCTFEGSVCEAGDMAIFDGTNWKIVTGENQVSIVGNKGEAKTTIAIGPAKDVLVVEGKTLTLALDYKDLNDNHLSVTKGGSVPVNFVNMTVGSKVINISEGEKQSQTIGKVETIQKASNLKDGAVSFTGIDTLVTDVNWGTFNQGSLSTLVMNEDARTFNVTGGSLSKTTTEDFVTGVTLGKVALETATQGEEGAFALVGDIQSAEGSKTFVSGVNGSTEFTVAGYLQPEDGETAQYVKGINGDYVTGINAGSFSLNKGDQIAIGFTAEASTGDVLSSVTVTPTTTDVFSSASVNDHVLSFGTSTVVNNVSTNASYKSLETTGYKFTSASANTATFQNAGFSKVSDVKYTLNTAKETIYTTTPSYYKLTTPQLEVSKGGYEINHTNMVANVSANTFGVSLTGGVLPTLGASTVVKGAVITGSVGTDLEYTDVTINAVDPNAMTINLPGVYTLVENAENGIEVGVAGELATKTANVDLSGYVTEVAIVETKA